MPTLFYKRKPKVPKAIIVTWNDLLSMFLAGAFAGAAIAWIIEPLLKSMK